MSVIDSKWSETEKKIAQQAFKDAYQREISFLMQEVRDRAGEIADPDDMWLLHDFLSAQRHNLDGKYDEREASLIFVFAQLLKEGWLKREELVGLDDQKRAKIAALARM